MWCASLVFSPLYHHWRHTGSISILGPVLILRIFLPPIFPIALWAHGCASVALGESGFYAGEIDEQCKIGDNYRKYFANVYGHAWLFLAKSNQALPGLDWKSLHNCFSAITVSIYWVVT